MSTFRFLHAADLHLDTPFEGVQALRPGLRETLQDASLKAFSRLVDLAIEKEVAFVLFAGDIYDGEDRGLRAQRAFLRGLRRLSEAGIRSFIVHGNHDPAGGNWSAIPTWPEGVHAFGSDGVEAVPVERDGKRVATIYGQSFRTRAERANLARKFRRGPEPGLHVGLLHANAGGQQGHDPYAPCSLDDLRDAGMDYWALGHVHTRQILFSGEQWAVYPGNLQGRSFKPSEQGEKGAKLITVENNRITEATFCPLAPVVFDTVEVDVEGVESELEVLDRLHEAAALHGERRGCEGLLLRAALVGQTPLHRKLLRLEEEEVLDDLNDESSSASPWVVWERLEVRTRPEADREQLAEQNDLLGEVLRMLDRFRGDPNVYRETLSEVDTNLGGQLGRAVGTPSDEELQSLLENLEIEALARLRGDE